MGYRSNFIKARIYWTISLSMFLLFFIDRASRMAGHDPWNGLMTSCLLGLVPLPFHIGLIYWLDRMEPEPPALIWESILWGGTGAVVLAFILETIGDDMAILFKLDEASLEFLSTSVSAPVIEESLKAAALFFIFLRHPDDFEDVADGIIYGAMVGIGFTAIENVLYYESAWIRGGNDETFSVFDLRALTSYSHPLFTAMTGIGLGMTATKGKRLLRPEPLLGLLLASVLHGFWNYGGPAAWLICLSFAIAIFNTLLRSSLRDEEQFLRKHLQPELKNGHLTKHQYEEICDAMKRWHSWSTGKSTFGTWQEARRVHLAAKELAFHRYRVALQSVGNDPVEQKRERAYLKALISGNRPPAHRGPFST